MHVIDTSPEMERFCARGSFDREAWARYMDAALPGGRALCEADLEESLEKDLDWARDFLPVLDAACRDAAGRARVRELFRRVTEGLEARIVKCFGRAPEADVVLYLGLCSGAGWVTELNGKCAVLLGIEKILELSWDNADDMTGLVYHELGHVYQAQFGVLHRDAEQAGDDFLWQLFTEGIAMVFEQEVAGSPEYFHQDKNGWKAWLDAHLQSLAADFRKDLETMTPSSQRYFGDWVNYEGQLDAGYYLGARLVRHMLAAAPFDELICFDIPAVRRGFEGFLNSLK